MVYRDEDSILDKIYEYKYIFGLVLRRFRIFRIIEENAYLKKYSTLQQRAHKIGF